MQNLFKSLAALLALTLAGTLSLPAQTVTGSIVGTVVDSSGLPIAGAGAAVTHIATGAARNVRTNERGDFLFSSLQPGEYNLAVTAKGFKTLQQQNIALSATQT